MTSFRAFGRVATTLAAGHLVAFLAGCPLDPQAARLAAGLEPTVENQTVTVRFRNFTRTEAVNVAFFATNDPLASLPADLFVPQLLITDSVGVAGTGLIPPMAGDSIEFPCSPQLTLGTSGGEFLDAETGALSGVGTPRWAQEGPLALCGGVITFDYAEVDGVFVTTVNIAETQ